MGRVKEAFSYIWDWDEEDCDWLPPTPEETEEVEKEEEKGKDNHKDHNVVKSYVCPHGEPIVFYYCRDCDVEVKE